MGIAATEVTPKGPPMSSPSESVLRADLDLDRLVAGQHHDPHHVLGAHPARGPDGRDQVVTKSDDPYRYWPTLGPVDLHLLAEGRHEGLWRHLGAQVRVHQGTPGT